MTESTDDFIYCSDCGVAIDPGYGAMRYLLGSKEGFLFFHDGPCIEAALVELDEDGAS